MNNHALNSRQLDLFSTDQVIDSEISSTKQTADYLGVTEVKLHYDAAQELRFIATQPGDPDNLSLTDRDLIFGFPRRTILLEYFARLHELAYQNWLLQNANRLDFLGIYGSEEWLPRILELYACNLILFTYNCWTEYTSISSDGGIDGLVFEHDLNKSWKKNLTFGIQTKLYTNNVPISDIREFYGAMLTFKPTLKSGLFLTSSHSLPKVKYSDDIKLFLVDGNALNSILNLVDIASQWFITYTGCHMDVPPYDSDFPEVAARLCAIREKINTIIKIEELFPLRREKGLQQETVNRWMSVELDQLF